MKEPTILQSLAALIERNLSIRHVYGEPVIHGDITVIPVASVSFALGGGEGRNGEKAGGGGSCAVHMTPVGTLEVGPQGTRFVRFPRWAPLLGAAALGLAAGLLATRLKR